VFLLYVCNSIDILNFERRSLTDVRDDNIIEEYKGGRSGDSQKNWQARDILILYSDLVQMPSFCSE